MNTDQRFHSLDALRAWALLAGIALHATMSFLPGFREVGWPIADDSSSTTLAVLFYAVHIFRMSLFFAIAGFFAHLLMQRHGQGGFLRNRAKRIGLPLLLAMVLILPLTLVPLIWARQKLGLQGPPRMDPPIPQRGVPWGHLWFLYLLLFLYAATLLLRCAQQRLDRHGHVPRLIDRFTASLLRSRTAVPVLALPVAALLYAAPWWQAWGGIPVPVLGFVPNLPALAAYGLAFSLGWYLHRDTSSLQLLARDHRLYLPLALALSLVALLLVGTQPGFRVLELGAARRAAYAMTYMAAAWAWVLGLIGIAVRYLSNPSPAWRYLADASFWMYLVHLPLVWALQAWMLKWPLHWSLKYALIVVLAMAVLLVSYRYLVRATFIGQLLNGRRYPRGAIAGPMTSTAQG